MDVKSRINAAADRIVSLPDGGDRHALYHLLGALTAMEPIDAEQVADAMDRAVAAVTESAGATS